MSNPQSNEIDDVLSVLQAAANANEGLPNLHIEKAKAKLEALIRARQIEELREIPMNPNFIAEYIEGRISELKGKEK